MLIAVEHLLLKLRQPRSRADELIQLRRRLRDERARRDVADQERALAREVHARKLAVASQLRTVTSCRSCATGHPSPVGHYDGGACCSGVTAELFDDSELAALAHAGTEPGDLTPPSDDHAGCAFRGSRGCTLEVAHRPARCVHYICDTLRHELYDRGQLDSIEASLAELDAAMREYKAAHRERSDRAVLAPILDAIAASTKR